MTSEAAQVLSAELSEIAGFDEEDFDAIRVTTLNGYAELKNQNVVEVEHLRNEQKLKIPTGLGINPCNPAAGRAPNVQPLVDRYWQATRVTYQQITEWVNNRLTAPQIQEAIKDLSSQPGPNPHVGWGSDSEPANTVHDSDLYFIDIIFMKFSQALEMNFDIRDMGILNNEDMYVQDGDWQNIVNVPPERLTLKLHAFSLHSIAALNYSPCSEDALGGWVRAYGVGCGILPAPKSAIRQEYMCVESHPSPVELRTVDEYEKNLQLQHPLVDICLNILARFGLFHLNKDRTFKSRDKTMDRSCRYWTNTLKEITTERLQKELLGNKEVACRIAVHPFGLGQTYWLARVTGKHSLLTQELSVKVDDVTPPNVQRVMICDTARREWETLPGCQKVTQVINEMHQAAVDQITDAVGIIRANPPAYSGLYYLYGLAEQATLAPAVKEATDTLMPIVYGYAEAAPAHTDKRGRKYGIALARSLNAVRRDNAGAAKAWTNIWKREYGHSLVGR